MKYKVRDVVKIREDLKFNEKYNGLYFTPSMITDSGYATIISIYRINGIVCYSILENNYNYSEDMFECIVKKKRKEVKEEAKVVNTEVVSKDYNPGRYIKDYAIIVPNKVVEVLFKDDETEKMVCHKEDTFDIRRCLFIALAKHLYKKEYTFEGIEYKANKMMMMKRYVKTVDAAIKNHIKDELVIQRQKEQELEKQKSANKKHERLLAYKERCRKKEEERQIEIKKEAYLRAMREYDLEKKASKNK